MLIVVMPSRVEESNKLCSFIFIFSYYLTVHTRAYTRSFADLY